MSDSVRSDETPARFCVCGWCTTEPAPHNHEARTQRNYERALVMDVDNAVWKECESL